MVIGASAAAAVTLVFALGSLLFSTAPPRERAPNQTMLLISQLREVPYKLTGSKYGSIQRPVTITEATRQLISERSSASGYQYLYESLPVASSDIAALCGAASTGDPDFRLDFQGGPLGLGVKTARILDASSCDSSAAGNVSVTFEFSDHKAARYLNWTPVTGQITCTTDAVYRGSGTCEFVASVNLVRPRGKDAEEPFDYWPPIYHPPVTAGFLEERPVDAAPETKGFVNFNGAVERHPDGGLVMAYRNYHNHDDDSVEGNGNVTVQMGVVDLDEDYMPKGPPTMIPPDAVGHELQNIEDVRLFKFRGDLYVMFEGLQRLFLPDGTQDPTGRCEGRLWLAGLERVPPNPGNSLDGATARFRLRDPMRLVLEANHSRMAGKEKNYVPFVYDDTIHFIAHSNPPDVFRMPAAIDALREDLTVELEFVSAETEPVRWRHGIMCGGTPGVYDAELGGYVTIFHSKMLHQVNGSLPGRMRTYYMGCAVYAARPPFAIQQLSVIPLAGPESYTPSEHTKGWQIVFPVGIALTPEEVTVSYGKNDRGTQLIRFDRSMFAASLQPPVPARWT